MSGCGCNKESSCEDTKLESNQPETESCSKPDEFFEKEKGNRRA